MSPRRKMPTKAELIQLQKLYKTDEKIGERLGGVPAYLVAYWRRKKNVPRHSLPKFSESEVRNLWERYGDDDRCGLELGISKAAFYNWRRRYGIREKPAFLKLEQLELNFPGLKTLSRTAALYGKRTVAQKILAVASGKERVEVGELVVVEPDILVSHGNTDAVIERFQNINTEYVAHPSKIVVALSNCRDGLSENDTVIDNKSVREFVKRQGIKSFFDVHQGGGQQLVIEHGAVLPGQLVLGNDRHSPSYGALSAFAAAITNEEMASAWASGRMWLQVPHTIRIDVNGRRSRGVHAADFALSIIKQLGVSGVEYAAIEYDGSALSQMSVNDRAVLANLSAELGAKAVLCPFEAITRRYLTGRVAPDYAPVIADKDAVYTEMYQINVDRLSPQIAGPNRPDEIRAAAELEEVPVHLIVLGGCMSGHYEELRTAAEILKGRQVHPDCRLLVVPASRTVYLEALKKGLIRVLVEAGAIVTNPAAEVPLEGHGSWLAADERCLTTASCCVAQPHQDRDTEIYLCSAATAAASAVNAAITDPTRYIR